jgi:formate--tetrahydrofolate ligase
MIAGVTRTDIEIAHAAALRPIVDLARDRLGIPAEALEPYGRYKAKIDLGWLRAQPDRAGAKLVLVTAMTPTPAGEGKTTVVVGLGDALNRIGKRAVIALREPSMGPVFGIKGGAAGGGRAQVVPMEDINLHFTGDFAAIAAAHNLLAAMVDNHLHQGNALGIDARRIALKRVVDVNDRALRRIVVGLGGTANGFPREDGFDIVVASEVMAILCLAESLADLKARLARIVVARRRDGTAVTAGDLHAAGAMAVLLKDAIRPNLVQTLENNPALIHGGPFANIAHGCNSVIATRAALKLGEYAVTEAGFGADLGAEKFIDIKCRKSGLRPDAAVLVATLRALRSQGGVDGDAVRQPDLAAVERGLPNLERHRRVLREHFGLPVVVALNRFPGDSDAELAAVERAMRLGDTPVVSCRHWDEGSAGAEDLAHAVVALAESGRAALRWTYRDDESLWAKMRAIARAVYGAADIDAEPALRRQIEALEREGHGRLPVCVAKTPYSFSSDPSRRGAPSGHVVTVREVRLAAGAEFVVMICGDVMTMPGLPREPAALRIDIDDDGRISGLF